MLISTPRIVGAPATATSIDTGTVAYSGSTIVVDTGGGLDINMGTASGDDFSIDSSVFIVEGDTGNVGIGTTSPNGQLEVFNNNGSDVISKVRSDSATGDPLIWFQTDTSGFTMGLDNSDSDKFMISLDGDNDGDLASPVLAIDSSGNVGIGTESPIGGVLVVDVGATAWDPANMASGEIAFGDAGTDANVIASKTTYASTPGLQIGAFSNDTNANVDMVFHVRESDNTDFATTSTRAFEFRRYNDELLTILRNGNVGIGTTSPKQGLHIYGDGANIRLGDGTSSDAGNSNNMIEFVEAATAGGDIQTGFQIAAVGSGSNERLGIHAWTTTDKGGIDINRDTGNVGIGETAPDRQLHLYKADGTSKQIVIENIGAGDTAIEFRNLVTSWVVGCDNSDSDSFKIGSAVDLGLDDHLTIDSSGNVGINDSSPATQLHVTQSDPGAGLPVLTIEQLDTDAALMNYVGTEGGSSSIKTGVSAHGGTAKFLKIHINGSAYYIKCSPSPT